MNSGPGGEIAHKKVKKKIENGLANVFGVRENLKMSRKNTQNAIDYYEIIRFKWAN